MTTSTASPAAASDAELAAKVPAITVLFWVIKTLTTGMREALSDFLANIDLAAAIAIGVLGLAGGLWLQLRTRRYTTLLYWLAVAMVAVLGTTAADGLHLVGQPSVAIFAAAIAVAALGWRCFRLNPVVAFWVAYVRTRPLGASIADWLGKHASHGGGLGFGDGTVAAVAVAVIAVLVGYSAVRRTDVQTPDAVVA